MKSAHDWTRGFSIIVDVKNIAGLLFDEPRNLLRFFAFLVLWLSATIAAADRSYLGVFLAPGIIHREMELFEEQRNS